MRARLRLLPPADEPAPAESGRSNDDRDVLVARLVGGDARAAREVWRRYHVLVRGLVVRSIGPRAEVEDVVQSSFAALFRRIAHLQNPSALESFLIGITIREVRSELRRRRLRSWLRLTATGELPDSSGEGSTDDHEVFARLHRALDLVDPRARLAFVLRHVEGYELGEIASALDCSLATVKRKLTHAQERLASIAARDAVLGAYLGRQPERLDARPEEG